MVVYNPADDCFQVCEITQKTIQEAVKSLASDPDWGDPTGYDIVVTRKGEDLNTEYTIRAKPKKALPDVVKKRYQEFHCDLDALYSGDDPFAVEVADAETEEALPF